MYANKHLIEYIINIMLVLKSFCQVPELIGFARLCIKPTQDSFDF